ncbi:terminase large subunit domain-containing protein [Novosphingobium sp. P6W]|uniref:terminase large subunit domain-containing protein n=1 Tax=Novosphingobium sp. P6W TaxID=1609758 RepID=UPI0005C31040|nr:terminase family protein [Novosphingobium sp. P6W]AXB75485.1 oxidoreductase [Novosphingobium sp. P6W]KIS32491.1 oxidoreductase [Novosphingobium sp. P6W]
MTGPFLPQPGAPATAWQFDPRRHARSLYWRGWGISQIADEFALHGVVGDKGTAIPRATIESWKQRDSWDDAPSIRKIEDGLEIRLLTLIAKEKKTSGDLVEMEALSRQIESLARVRRYEEPGGHSGDLNEKVGNRNAGPRKKPKKNHFTADQAAELKRIFIEGLYDYQLTWWNALSQRTRMILKSRQIGATYYFAFEALIDVIETGRNQIFLSASKAQAHQFRSYIVSFAKLVGVSLTGDPMLITSDLRPAEEAAAEMHFLGTNFRTAQGRHGNFYFDEFFWVHSFEELNKVASGMATHKKWRKTYFSTPSTVAHPAYPYWTGERRNRRRKKEDRVEIDVSHAALGAKGGVGPDRIWRHIVNIEDAEAGGCDLFDIEELRDEYAPDEFANLFMCDFVDDTLSAFKFNDMIACGCDSLVDWTDFDIEGARPYGNRPVWAGYDPQSSENGDNAALVIAAPPLVEGGQFRILERHQLRGLDFQQQAEFIIAVLSRYNCTYLGVDAQGVGAGVYQLLAKIGAMPGCSVAKIEYSLEIKAQMIMKAQNVIRRGRLAFESSYLDIVSAFVSIKKTLTTSGRNVTFKAGRGGADGHADLAWAAMHILMNEPLDGKEKPKGAMEIIE